MLNINVVFTVGSVFLLKLLIDLDLMGAPQHPVLLYVYLEPKYV